MVSEAKRDPSPDRGPGASAPGPISAITYRDMHDLLAEAILNKGERKVSATVVRTMADLARLAIRLEMKALSVARQAPKSDFGKTLSSVYAAERAELCDAVAAVYDGRTSVADAKADLTRIRADIAQEAVGDKGRK